LNILFCSDGLTDARKALVDRMPDCRILFCPPSGVREALAQTPFDVIVPAAARIDADVMAAGSFGLIQQFGVGLEGVDVAAATEAGIWVANVPAAGVGNADSVAEHALMFMLALSRRLPRMKADLAARRISEPAGQALFGKTACLVGLGDIGVEIARRLHAFHMRVIAVRKRPELGAPEEARVERVYGMGELQEALGQAEYTILCAPLTSDTRGLIDRETIACMKPGSYLINVARGGLVDHDALLEALESEHLAGAGLDVFWQEPVDPDHPLFECNVIATPHVAGLTDSACSGIALTVEDNVRRHARGLAPQFAVNTPRSGRRLSAAK
jgi:phosphoglycerate dehydrogenase-like enzyme